MAFFSLLVFYLCGYHYYLIDRNETTNENMKHTYEETGNPYYRGCCNNFTSTLSKKHQLNWVASDEYSELDDKSSAPKLKHSSSSIKRKIKRDSRSALLVKRHDE